MELFLPSIFIFLVALAITFLVIPRFSPIVMAILAGAFLAFGVYHHYNLFKTEYRLSTWQDNLKLFAPAIFIGGVILIMIVAISNLFKNGSVPVPAIPFTEMPPANTATNPLTNVINQTMNAVSNVATTVANTASNVVNTVTPNALKSNKNKSNLSRSFIEVL